MAVMGVTKFERFFRAAAGLDVDKDDVKRYNDFVHERLFELVMVGDAAAHANGRDVIEVHDLPITAGLRKCIHDFRDLEQDIELRPLLEDLASRYPADLTLSAEAEARLPEVVGGLSLALGRSFKLIDPRLTNPGAIHWERAFQLFALLL